MDCAAADADAGDDAVKRLHAMILLVWCLHICGPFAAADGGAIVDRGEWGDGRFVLWVNPAPPTVGPAEWTLMYLGDAKSHAPQMVLRLEGKGAVWQEGNFQPTDGDGVLLTCVTSLPFEGEWTATLRADDSNWQPREVALRVQAAPAQWHAALPWMLLWIPAGVLMVLREWLAAKQRRTNT
jgi:hypothetical protein